MVFIQSLHDHFKELYAFLTIMDVEELLCKNTAIIILQYINLVKNKCKFFLIRWISGYLKNVWYLSTKLGFFQNLWILSQYTKAYHHCQREFYMIHIKFYSIWCSECLQMDRIQEDMTENYLYLRPFESSGPLLRTVDYLKTWWNTFYKCAELFVYFSDF